MVGFRLKRNPGCLWDFLICPPLRRGARAILRLGGSSGLHFYLFKKVAKTG